MQAHPSPKMELLRELLLVVFVFAGLILLLVVYISNATPKVYSQAIIAQARKIVTEDFEKSLLPFNTGLQIIKKWGTGYPQPPVKTQNLNIELLNTQLVPLVKDLDLQSYFHLATSLGIDYLLYRKGQSWLTSSVNIAEWGSRQKWQHLNLSGELVKEWWTRADYDPRTEPWYQQTLSAESEQAVWTEPYYSESYQLPVISGGIYWQRSDHEKIDYVAAFEVPLSEIHQKVAQLKATNNGLAFIANYDGHVFSPQVGRAQIFLPPSQIETPAIDGAVTSWESRSTTAAAPYPFHVDGKRWWAGFYPLKNSTRPLFWVGIAIPEADFLADVKQRRTLLFTLLTLVVISGCLLIVLIVRYHNKSLQQAE